MQVFPHLSAGEQWRDWPSMTEPLLVDILRRLDTLEDFYHFRGVCGFWRSVAAPTSESLASQHPLLLLPTSSSAAAYCDIFHGRLYAEATLPRRLRAACRPVAYAHGHLVGAIGTELVLWDIFNDVSGHRAIGLPRVPDQRCDRVLLSSRPSSPDCRVFLYSKTSEAAVWQVRIGDPCWTVVHRPQVGISDMIFFRDKLYAISHGMQLLAIDLGGESRHEILGSSDHLSLDPEKYEKMWLAASGEELLAVCRTNLTWAGIGFHIFMWDFGKNCWEEKLDLGGRALFMDVQGSAGSVATSETGIKGDTIYYLGHENDRLYRYCLEDRSLRIVPISWPGRLGESHGAILLPPVWVLPSIC